jgi:hypothetical protein
MVDLVLEQFPCAADEHAIAPRHSAARNTETHSFILFLSFVLFYPWPFCGAHLISGSLTVPHLT